MSGGKTSSCECYDYSISTALPMANGTCPSTNPNVINGPTGIGTGSEGYSGYTMVPVTETFLPPDTVSEITSKVSSVSTYTSLHTTFTVPYVTFIHTTLAGSTTTFDILSSLTSSSTPTISSSAPPPPPPSAPPPPPPPSSSVEPSSNGCYEWQGTVC